MKKVWAMMMVVVLISLFAGCSNTTPGTSSVDVALKGSNLQQETEPFTEAVTDSEETTDTTSGESSIDDSDDMEPFIELTDSPNGFYLKKGETLLTFSDFVFKNSKLGKRLSLTESDDESEHLIFCTTSQYIPTFQEGDSVVVYSGSNVPKLTLIDHASFGGYTICAYKYKTGGCHDFAMYDGSEKIETVRTDHYDINIADKEEKNIEDRYNLKQDEEYTLYWYTGTKYNEVKMKAVYPFYEISHENTYEIEGTLTKKGYAEYDISSIPAGIYGVETSSGNVTGILKIE